MHDDFLAFKEYFLQSIDKVPADSFFRGSMDHKFKHSIEVLHIGQTILNKTPELSHQTEEFRALAQQALLFHDLGRFEENALLYNALQQNSTITAASNPYDHGLIGYELLKQDPRYNDTRILFALKWHGKTTEDIVKSKDWKAASKRADFDEIKQILWLVRDADKLANLYHIKADNHLTKDLFFKQLTPEALNAPISAPVLKQFLSGKTIIFSSVYSFADRILMVLAFQYDLNYQASRKIYKHHRYNQYLIKLLSKYHQFPDDIAKIKQKIKECR